MTTNTILNRQLARRSFIKGLAGAGALSAMQAQQLFAQTAAPVRVMFVALQHGWGSGHQAVESVTGSEFDFKLPRYWQPFEAIKQHCVFIDGLRGTFWGNAHDESYSDLLTAAVPVNAPADRSLGGPFPLPTGPSIDWLLEEHSKLPALRFCAGYTSWGAAHHPLSFNKRLDNLAYYRSPLEAYESLFKGVTSGGSSTPKTDPVAAQLFSYLSQEANRVIELVESGGESQRNKLLSYLDSVQAVQKKVSATHTARAATATVQRAPVKGQSLGQDIDSFLDMIRVAFTNDTHRVAVLGMGEQNNEFAWTDTDGRKYTGHSAYTGDFHHEIAHYNEGKPRDAELAYMGYVAYYAQKITRFAQSLANTVDVDGRSLLDNTIIVLTGEVGNGAHDRRHKPHIVIGGGGGAIRTGRWYNTPKADASVLGSRDDDGKFLNIRSVSGWLSGDHSAFSHADLYTRIANLAGLNIRSLGIDSMFTGPLDL